MSLRGHNVVGMFDAVIVLSHLCPANGIEVRLSALSPTFFRPQLHPQGGDAKDGRDHDDAQHSPQGYLGGVIIVVVTL